MKKPFKLITLSDIHIAHQPLEQIQKEFFDEEEGFLAKVIQVAKQCQKEKVKFLGVAITGDLFDHQVSLNSNYAKFAMDLIHTLARVVINEFGGNIIILKGTRSHDLDQIMIFEPFTLEFEDSFFIANTLSYIELEGYDILLIPEEYMKNQNEYYQEAFENQYDLILAHGFLKFNCFNKNEVERSMPEMPIFDQEELINVARLSIFGHDHVYKSYRGQIYYNGSYSRLCHGEEDDKGALLITMDSKKHKVERLINTLAPNYKAVTLEKLVKGDLNFESAVKAIKKLKENTDFLKIKIGIDTVKSNPTLVNLINNKFNTQYKKLGIVIEAPAFNIRDGKLILLSENEELKEKNEDNIDVKYNFLFDNKLTLEEKILEFVKTKHPETDLTDFNIDSIRDAIGKEN
ncbi:MAG: hypothetical protein [Bacteriophage sp.]|nr:MAG: hypothetical protein [Bacteriophage sp.]